MKSGPAKVRLCRAAGSVFVLSLLLCVSLAASSSTPGASATTNTGPQRGGTLTIAQNGDPTTLDPTATGGNLSILVFKNVCQMLYDSTVNGQQFIPELATNYSISANRLAWTFHLRPGVKFPNGKPMTSTDVKFSIARNYPTTSDWYFIDDVITSITTPNPLTVVIHTKQPVADMLAIVSLYANCVWPAGFNGETAAEFFQKPMGTGPFYVTQWLHGVSITALRNPYYWQKGLPYLDKVIWTDVPDDTTRLLELEGNQIQIDEFPAFSDLAQLQALPDTMLAEATSTQVEYLAMSEKVKPFQDLHVREAINLALNRSAMVKAALFGNGVPIGTFLAPNIPGSSSMPLIPYNLAAAKRQMAESTVPHGFTTTLNILSGSALESAVGAITQEDLLPLGIHIKIQVLDASTWLTDATTYHYDMTTLYVNTDIPDASELVEIAAGSGGNFVGWNDPALTKIANEAGAVFSPAERKALYKEYLARYDANYPLAPLFLSPWVYGLSKSVHGFQILMTGNYRLQYVWLSS